jgi:hypothetical protein
MVNITVQYLEDPEFTSQVRVAVPLQTCIKEVFGSNLNRNTGYPMFLVICLGLSRKTPLQYPDYATTASFRIPYNSLFTHHSTIWSYIVWNTDIVKYTRKVISSIIDSETGYNDSSSTLK